MKKTIAICFLLGATQSIYSQSTYEADYRKAYEERLTKETIDGVYIPKDLNDCVGRLKTELGNEVTNSIMVMTEDEVIAKLNNGTSAVGMWIRNEWGLYDGSRLSLYFRNIGLSYPEDISAIILTALHRDLNKKEFDAKNLFSHYIEKRSKIIEERKAKNINRYSD